jgi:protein ImuB
MRRIACLRIPYPQLALCFRRHPEWQGQPVILGGIPPQRGTVTGASKAAREAGVELGMTLNQAQSIVPQAHFVPLSSEEERQEWERIAVLLGRFSPMVELAEPGVFYLDAQGMGRLYPTEREYLAHIRFTLQGEGYQSRVAMAGNRFSARVATYFGDIHVVPHKREPMALAPMPVSLLPLSPALSEALQTLGIQTMGALAKLPTGQLEARFGREGIEAARLAAGEDPTPLRGYQPKNLTVAELELDGPIEGSEPVRFVMKTVTDRMIGELATRGLACEEARLHLRLDNRTTAVIGIVPAAPTLSAPLLWELARTRLDREPLQAPIVSLRMEAVRVCAAEPDQKPLFTRNGDHERAHLAVARLRGLLGDEAVLVPRQSAAYRPERRVTWMAYHETGPTHKKKDPRKSRPSPAHRPRRGPGFYKPKDSGSAPLLYPLPFGQPPTAAHPGPRAHGSGAI